MEWVEIFTYVSVVRLRPVRASGPPRVIQTLLVFAAFRNRSRLLRHRTATSRFRTSALPTSVVLLLLASPPVRLATLRLGYSDREPPRGQRAISRFRQIDHHPAPAHWRVLVRHPAKMEFRFKRHPAKMKSRFKRHPVKMESRFKGEGDRNDEPRMQMHSFPFFRIKDTKYK